MHTLSTHLTLLFCISLLLTASATALPQFAARTGERCQSCHVDPSGKGMRTLNGANFGRNELPLSSTDDTADIEDFITRITKNINTGGDFRTLYFYNEIDKTGSFFQMEGNLYFDFRLNKKVRVYVSKGLYTGFEVFGLARVLPLDGYIKVGKFVPAYGLRIDDHNAFIRGGRYSSAFASTLPAGYPGGLRFGERAEDTGMEFGFAPSIFSITAGVFNGIPGGGLTGTAGSKTYAVALRGEAIIPSETINISVGGSFYNYPNPNGFGTTQFYGAFATLGVMKNLTLLAEADRSVNPLNSKNITGQMLYTQLDYFFTSGLDVFAGYEFYDPDIELANGTASSINIGASFFPMSGVELRPVYHINKETPVEISNNEFQMMFHFYL
jgi:hypothetical protein